MGMQRVKLQEVTFAVVGQVTSTRRRSSNSNKNGLRTRRTACVSMQPSSPGNEVKFHRVLGCSANRSFEEDSARKDSGQV